MTVETETDTATADDLDPRTTEVLAVREMRMLTRPAGIIGIGNVKIATPVERDVVETGSGTETAVDLDGILVETMRIDHPAGKEISLTIVVGEGEIGAMKHSAAGTTVAVPLRHPRRKSPHRI
jgi:hypothetical protein